MQADNLLGSEEFVREFGKHLVLNYVKKVQPEKFSADVYLFYIASNETIKIDRI